MSSEGWLQRLCAAHSIAPRSADAPVGRSRAVYLRLMSPAFPSGWQAEDRCNPTNRRCPKLSASAETEAEALRFRSRAAIMHRHRRTETDRDRGLNTRLATEV